MQNRPIVAIRRGNMFSTFSSTFIFLVVVIAILIFFDVLRLDQITDPFIVLYLSVIFGIPFLLAFLKYIDKKPMIIIQSSGISMRKSRLPFSGLREIEWNDIKKYDAKINRTKFGETMYLIITQKSTNKKYHVDLLDLDADSEEVLNGLKRNIRHPQKFEKY